MATFDNKKHKLEGTTGNESGGLILPKKRQKDDEHGAFKKPTTSLLGLDALAREKRKKRELKEKSESGEKKRKLEDRKRGNHSDSRDYSDGNIRVSFGSGHSRDRHYRLDNAMGWSNVHDSQSGGLPNSRYLCQQ